MLRNPAISSANVTMAAQPRVDGVRTPDNEVENF
jgi:hypothetical protein